VSLCALGRRPEGDARILRKELPKPPEEGLRPGSRVATASRSDGRTPGSRPTHRKSQGGSTPTTASATAASATATFPYESTANSTTSASAKPHHPPHPRPRPPRHPGRHRLRHPPTHRQRPTPRDKPPDAPQGPENPMAPSPVRRPGRFRWVATSQACGRNGPPIPFSVTGGCEPHRPRTATSDRLREPCAPRLGPLPAVDVLRRVHAPRNRKSVEVREQG
jgi:hypothetical protein